MRDSGEDRDALGGIGGKPIDLVCVNLYPFEQTVARGASHDETIENIDIGGPSMVRSAAKNQARVTVVTEPSDYAEVLAAVTSGDGPNASLRARLAAKAFTQTAAYDGAISAYLTSQGSDSKFPGALTLSFSKAYDVRYGENPHQQGAFYIERNAPAGSLALAESLGAGGKELSFNNLVDVDATIEAVREFEGPAAVVVKHTNPCGVATAASLEEAYRIAREADAQSAFGGIVALNREVDEATANAVAETFIECIIAPSFAPSALERLQKKRTSASSQPDNGFRPTTPPCNSSAWAAVWWCRIATRPDRARCAPARSSPSVSPTTTKCAHSTSHGAFVSTSSPTRSSSPSLTARSAWAPGRWRASPPSASRPRNQVSSRRAP